MSQITGDAIEPAIRTYIVESFLLGEGDDLTADTSLLDSGALDSTAVMEIVDFLEEEFAIAIRPDELTLENLDSVARIAGFVDRKQRGD